MLLNFAAPKLAPNIVASPKSNIDVNAVLGLAPSQYSGLQSVGDTGYFYGNNRMYEKYTPQPSPMSIYGYPLKPRPSYNMGIFGTGVTHSPPPSFEELTVGGQQFRTASPDIQGFTKMAIDDDKYQKDSVYEYSPSMAYVYANTPRPAPVPTPNVTSFLSTPTAMATPQGNYGAGRYLSGLLGSPISYGLPNDQTGSDS